MGSERWTTTTHTGMNAGLAGAAPGALERGRMAHMDAAKSRQAPRIGSQVEFAAYGGTDCERGVSTNQASMALCGEGRGLGGGRNLNAEASARASLKHNLTRTSWALARNGDRCLYASTSSDLVAPGAAEARAAKPPPAKTKADLCRSVAPYEIDDNYTSAAGWSTNERARQGGACGAGGAAAAAANTAAARDKGRALKAALTRSSHSLGDANAAARPGYADDAAWNKRDVSYAADFGPTSFAPRYTRLANFANSQVSFGEEPPAFSSTAREHGAAGVVPSARTTVLAGMASGGADATPGSNAEMKSNLTKTSFVMGNDTRFM